MAIENDRRSFCVPGGAGLVLAGDMENTKVQYTFMSEYVFPELLKNGVTQDQIDQMTIRNPRAVFEDQGAY